MSDAAANSRRRVNLVGVDHWCRHLARLIESAQPDVDVFVLRSLDLVRHGRGGATVRVGYRPGARTWRGRSFDLLYAFTVPARRRRTYWIGSDVAHAVSDGRGGALHRRWRKISAGRNASGAPWFVDELTAIGVESSYLRFPHQPVAPGVRPWPDKFAVSVYIPVNNHEAYGSLLIPELADRTPDVVYRVYGGGPVEHRSNIVQLGFVDNPLDEIEKSILHLRLTEHDGIAGTVREALAFGRYVAFGYDIPGVIFVDIRDVQRIAETVEEMRAKFLAGSLASNVDGVGYAESMDAHRDAQALVRWITRQ